MEDLLKYLPPAPVSQSGPEGALRIDPKINLPVSILGDLESGSREIYMALKEEEEDNSQQCMSIVMTSEVER